MQNLALNEVRSIKIIPPKIKDVTLDQNIKWLTINLKKNQYTINFLQEEIRMLDKMIDVKNGQKLKYQDMKKNILKKQQQKPGRKPKIRVNGQGYGNDAGQNREKAGTAEQRKENVYITPEQLLIREEAIRSLRNPQIDPDASKADKPGEDGRQREDHNRADDRQEEKSKSVKKKPGRPKKKKNPFVIMEIVKDPHTGES